MCEVFPIDKSLNWNKEFERNFESELDIYFTEEFFDLFKDLDSGDPFLFLFKDGKNVVLYPFLMRKINQLEFFGTDDTRDLYDMGTPYGFGGPISNTDDANFLEAFKAAFERFCKKHNVVTEFVRFNPIIQNQDKFKSVFKIEYVRKTILVDLSKGEDVFVKNMDAKNRNTIRSAQKKNVKIEFDFELKEIDKFIFVYNKTMKRVNAGGYYFFSAQFYYRMINLLKDKVFLVKSVKDGELLGMSLFFKFNGRLHYFLSGSNDSGHKYDANNLLLYEVACWGINNGFKQIHLGGGNSASPEDPLFRFKKKFNKKGCCDFYVMKKMHDHKAYAFLSLKWAEFYKTNIKEPEDYFPVYRKPKNEK